MNGPADGPPGSYELRIGGHLDEHWSAWFDGMSLTHDDDGTTSLRGPVTDQAELHGLLTKVRDLGVTLLSVRAIDANSRPSAAHPPDTGPTPATTPPRRNQP